MAIIIGDTHGNVEKVKAFLDYKPEVEHVALGDYLDSFTEPQERQIEALQMLLDSKAVLLWGNHELHYLQTPPWVCTGFQYGKEKPIRELIEANKYRFKAAHVADGWLLTHAGAHSHLLHRSKDSDVVRLAKKFNAAMRTFLKNPETYQRINYSLPSPPIFNICVVRGGDSRFGGIFWFDFKRESRLADVKQVFGHTETPEPVVTDMFVAMDTTNCKDFVYLFDTENSEVVKLEMPQRSIRPDIDWGDYDMVVPDKEVIEEQRAGFQVDDIHALASEAALGRYDRVEVEFDDDLYWGFADSEQFVVVKAKTATEALKTAESYWHIGQTITPTGTLPLNAREIAHKRNYQYDNIIWHTGPDSTDYFFNEFKK